jgi:hypothetical protein
MMVEKLEKFYIFQDPQNFLNLRKQTTDLMSDEDLLSRGDPCTKKLQEAFVASIFAWGFQKYILPIQIRMAKVEAELLDFEMKYQENNILQFEIVMAIEPERRLQQEYRDGRRPSISTRTFSGEPAESEQIVLVIEKKTQMARNIQKLNRHLMVYVNLSGHLQNLEWFTERILASESIFQSIWLVRGDLDEGGMALLSNSYGFPCPERNWLPINS